MSNNKDLLINVSEDEFLKVEPWNCDTVLVLTYHFGDCSHCTINKDQAKQIVEHLTKVFEL